MRRQGLTQALKRFKATALSPGDPRSIQRLRVFPGATHQVDLLEPLFHPPRSGRLEARALQPMHIGRLFGGPVFGRDSGI